MKGSFTLLLAAVVTVMLSLSGAAAQSKKHIQLLPGISGGHTFAPGFVQMVLLDRSSHKFFNTHNVVSMTALTALVAIDACDYSTLDSRLQV